MILSNKGITKVQIRLPNAQAGLHLCCSQFPKDRFSHIEAHYEICVSGQKSQNQDHTMHLTTRKQMCIDGWRGGGGA